MPSLEECMCGIKIMDTGTNTVVYFQTWERYL